MSIRPPMRADHAPRFDYIAREQRSIARLEAERRERSLRRWTFVIFAIAIGMLVLAVWRGRFS